MTAPKEQSPECDAHSGKSEEASRLRMRLAPQAVIIVTEHNRIVLVDSPSWSMEEFNRREIIEIVIPEGFQAAKPRSADTSQSPADLPVELIIGRSLTDVASRMASRQGALTKTAGGAAFALEPALMQAANDPIFAIQRDGRILIWNAGARNHYGFSSGEVLDKSVSLLIPYERRTTEERYRNRVLEGQDVRPYDTVRIRKDGTSAAVCVSLTPIRDAAGAVVGTLEIGRDVSGRQAEEKTLAAQVASLTQSNRELQDYALVVAHDLQAPLNMVSSYFSELSERCAHVIEGETRDLLATASAAVPRMQKLIKDLLDLARLGGRSPDLAQTDCSAVVSEILCNLEMAIRQSAANVTIEHLPTVLADPTQLGEVFQNLISNAINYRGDRAPEIRISAERRPGEWLFSVSDNGIGIDQALIPKLFQPLQRLQPNGPRTGSGLGLAIARKIMTRHGGRIWVESKPRVGSTFYFTLPANDSKDPTDSQ